MPSSTTSPGCSQTGGSLQRLVDDVPSIVEIVNADSGELPRRSQA